MVFLFFGKSLFRLDYVEETPFFVRDLLTGDKIATQKTEHYTLIFNTFVFMQVFNEINSRKLGAKEYNVFEGFLNNPMFLAIVIGTGVVQVALV